ncbi:MAG: nucleotidyltransferase domain-containing protein [Saprospiraceae bacterium]|jgi:predicted nucleotidyltransferase|nr:nucleotidyltransferase domain-containing protein [Saprospiraceae bacterium]
MDTREAIMQEAKTRLNATFGDTIKHVVLFGSRAWGNPQPWSDYDILVVVRKDGACDWQTIRAIRHTLYAIDKKYDVLTQALVVSDFELNNTLRGRQDIFQDALQNGIYA